MLLRAMLETEMEVGFPQFAIGGVDEVGRGCLAGPVVAACAVLPTDLEAYQYEWLSRVTDSKLLSPEAREDLEPRILSWVRGYGIASASPVEIDTLNIHHASLLAMERAVASVVEPPHFVLVDGKFVPPKIKGRALVKGDSRSLAIACASIIAKVYRDRLMTEMDGMYPGYGLSSHKGYPTAKHLEALDGLGVTKIHRKTFAPVKNLLRSKQF